ncbi:hypothetical protein D9611_014246 [Ephemerocybe angulata]|uniref:HAT C-terminal dimerisation domain-containing protein n=1 Tax=Ephemerocybe angulata TaxID=980116 RepID=A0A8H5B7S0_9AGAR|nr:hypothetical protein D9611_014246 [Tulosesus angulatus]
MTKYEQRLKRATRRSLNKQTASNSAPSRPPDMEDDWMDAMQASHHNSDSEDGDSGAAFRDDFAELNKYLAMQTVSRKDCPDPVAWWGHHGSEFPVLRKMARDYLAIPASSALIERAFSMSARTDDPRRRNMGGLKFGMVQKLRDAYREGRLEAAREAWVKIDPDFNFFDDIAEIVELLEV